MRWFLGYGVGEMKSLIDIKFDYLIPKRDMFEDGSVYFCICVCGRTRVATRRYLTSQGHKACQDCAKVRRALAGGRKPDRGLPPDPEPVLLPLPVCTGRIENGKLWCSASCPRHGIASSVGLRAGDVHINGQSLGLQPE